MFNPGRSSDPVSDRMPTASAHVPDRWLLQVRGLAQVIVEDQEGRRIGPSRDPEYPTLIENQIPGASYGPGQVFSSVFLNQPGIYTFTLIAQAPNSMHVSLSLYNAVSKFDTFFFQGIPMANRSQARLVYDTANRSGIPTLALDREGNGEIERIHPTILSPQASDDVEPPTTQIVLNDDVVTVSATDNPGGAGIFRTYYTTDGITHSVYTGPFALPPDAKIIMAYSEDRAGNLEYPGAVWPVLGLSEPRVVMTATIGAQEVAQHTVDVVNLDPFPLTSQIDWVVSTEVPWLSVEPRAGKTPQTITLLVRVANLSRGSHETTVSIEALTPKTVFAERILPISITVV